MLVKNEDFSAGARISNTHPSGSCSEVSKPTVWSTRVWWRAPTRPCNGRNSPPAPPSETAAAPPPCARHSQPRAAALPRGGSAGKDAGCRPQSLSPCTLPCSAHTAAETCRQVTREHVPENYLQNVAAGQPGPGQPDRHPHARADVLHEEKASPAVRPARTGPCTRRCSLTGPWHTSGSQWGSVPLPTKPEASPWTWVA